MRRVGDVLQVEETIGTKSPQWGWVWCIRVFQLKVWVSDQWHQHDRELGRNAEFQRILPRPIESQMHFNENVGNVQSHYSLRSTGLEEFKGGYRSWCTVGQENKVNKVMNLWEAFHLNLPIPPTSSLPALFPNPLCVFEGSYLASQSLPYSFPERKLLRFPLNRWGNWLLKYLRYSACGWCSENGSSGYKSFISCLFIKEPTWID